MRSTQAAAVLTLATSVSAFWRMPCRSRTGLGRLDPIMNPGEVADHVHAIHGGGNFGLTTTYEDLTQASGDLNCTSCEVVEDQSAYWTPALYWLADNGTAQLVEQVGGMLAYYLMYLDDLQPFPEGFRMIAGNMFARNFTGPFPDTDLSSWPTDPTDQFFLQQRALGFNCLDYSKTPEASLYRHQFPDRDYMDANCVDGLRLELAFPSCGTGAIDSPDHKSHMAYPSLVKEGNCPAGYDVHYPFMFYETIWATNAYIGQGGKFVLSYGDPIGTGYHGDFIMGWKSSDFLKGAMNTCTSQSGQIEDCPLFSIQSDETAAQCTFPIPEVLKNDDATGPCEEGLPVDVPIQDGPAQATRYPVAGRSGSPTTGVSSTSASTSFSLPTLSYSAANPSETSSAQGGIIVAAYSSGAAHHTESSSAPAEISSSAPASMITSSPSVSDAASAQIIATSYSTSGYVVQELVIEEVEVTVTASAMPTGANYRRHMQKHKRHHS